MSLLEKYILARWCYAIGEDFIDDIEYRQIEEKLKAEMPNNEYIRRSWSDDPEPTELLRKYNLYETYHRDIKFDHKSESIRSINSVVEYERTFKTLDRRARLSYKLDGFNIQVNYYNGRPISAETRGRTGNSLNANVIMKIVPQEIPFMGKVKVTGECVIPNSKWKRFQLETGNTSQRNSVSSAMANDMTEYLEFVAFNIQTDTAKLEGDIYTILQNCKFKVPAYMYVSDFKQLEVAVRLMGRRNKAYDYPTDGLVIESDKYQLAIRIGEWEESVLSSYVVGYERNIGVYNRPMVVNIKPIIVDGAKRSQVSVTSLQYLIDYNLRPGAPIAFDIRSAVNAVLNTTETENLQALWHDRYEEYREKIDNIGG